VARNFTEADYAALVANINELDTTKAGTAIATVSSSGLMSAADKQLSANRDGYGVTAGTGAIYTVTLSPAPTLTAGLRVTLKFHLANTGAATLNVNGLGAKSILKSNGSALSAGNIKLNSVYTLVYDGSNFILQGEGGEYGTAVASEVLSGKTIGTDGGIVTGTMPHFKGHNEAAYVEPNPGGTRLYMMPHVGYYDAGANNTWIYKDDPNYIASNIRAGASIFGIVGTLIEGKRVATGSQPVPQGMTISASVSGLTFRPRIISVWCPSHDNVRTQAYYIVGGYFNNTVLMDMPYTGQRWYMNQTANWSITADGFSFNDTYSFFRLATTIYWEAVE
jgi:hypothetical protein